MPYPTIITTNYDDVLEHCLTEADLPYHLLSYQTSGPHRGLFYHQCERNGLRIIERPYNIRKFSDAFVIVKLNGGLDSRGRIPESYLTTRLDYWDLSVRIPDVLPLQVKSCSNLAKTLKEEGFPELVELVQNVEQLVQEKNSSRLWDVARDAPRGVAEQYQTRVVQFIDEFQYMNSEICRDQNCTQVMHDFAASYIHTAEYKNAPLLIAGSWVGWLIHLLQSMLPSRFIFENLESMPEEECLEMILKYSQILNVPVSESAVHQILEISEGNPFYISSLFLSRNPNKDLTTLEGVQKTLDFETFSSRNHSLNLDGVHSIDHQKSQ